MLLILTLRARRPCKKRASTRPKAPSISGEMMTQHNTERPNESLAQRLRAPFEHRQINLPSALNKSYWEINLRIKHIRAQMLKATRQA